MRKYKMAIYVGRNVSDLMMLPCVMSCEKLQYKVYIEGTDREITKERFKYTLFDGTNAYEGSWILWDVCDNWHVMTAEDYERHKDDEISSDTTF